MLNNVFKKTLYEKRWMAAGWSIAVFLFTVFIVLVFPVFRDTLGETLKTVPDSLKSFMGDAQTFQNLNAYIDVQVIYQMVFMPVVMAIILCTGLIAGKEEQGLLQSLFAQPIKRSKAYLEMLLASVLIFAFVSIGIFVAAILGALIIGVPIDASRLLLACFATWLLTVLIGTFSLALGAITSKRGFSGMLTGIFVFLMYIVTALAPSVKFLKYPNYLSPFKYFNSPSVILNGLRWTNIVIMLATTIVFGAIGYFVFTRRDIYQK
jgi:ABC-type transport system involved in multi-copper enzyme maturation permease subunit